MKIIEHCDIKVEVADAARIPAFEIARVKPGFANDVFGLFLRGRLAAAGPRPGAIEFWSGGARLDRCGLGAAGEDFECALNLLGAPAEGTIELWAVYDAAPRVRLGAIELRRARLAGDYRPRLAPIILNSMGRSGTTVFMRLLSAHPGIHVHPEYPHELMAAHYWLVLFEALTSPMAGGRLVDKWAVRDPHGKRVPPHPYYRLGVSPGCARYVGGDYARLVAGFCQRAIDELYDALLGCGAGGEPVPARYFAEKSLPFPVLIQELYPAAREIFLLRDVRDNVCSALAFNRKRGTQAFGREGAESDAEFAASRAREFRTLCAQYRDRTATACLVRYEDLIDDPPTVTQRVLDYLELPSGPDVVAAMTGHTFAADGKLAFHQTAASPSASVGRWRQELAPELIDICRAEAGAALAELGYPA